MTPDFLSLPDRRLAYQQRRGRSDLPGVIFISGYASDMTGTKAEFLAERCASAQIAFVRFDCRGHGQSSGDFLDGTIGDWFDDASSIFKALTEGPQIVVGSSMGAWLGLKLAIQEGPKVKAFIGIAPAPDFTEDLLMKEMTVDQHRELERDGVIYLLAEPPSLGLPITKKLIEESRAHLLLTQRLPINCPVRLIQGLLDTDVPWQHALRVAEAIDSNNVRVYLVKDGEHRLSREQDLNLLWRSIEEFL